MLDPILASLQWLEWTGAVCGLAGSLLIALKTRYSGWGFVLFLASNMAWLAFGLLTQTYGMVAMQVGFTVTSLIGIRCWLMPGTQDRTAPATSGDDTNDKPA